MLIVSLILVSALLLDYLLGETRFFHPLVGFGKLTSYLEKKINNKNYSNQMKKIMGIIGWICLVLPLPIIYFLLHQQTLTFYIIDALVLYFAVGLNSLKQHALNIFNPLESGNLNQARSAVAMIVSRQTDELSEKEISRATVESVLENGHDAVIASLFWFVIGGAPLVIIHRFSNTLDAMWGYRTERFNQFGWFSAKFDDLIGWPSAKVSALCYVLGQSFNLKKIAMAFENAKSQGRGYKSLNGGWVMSAGASILNIKLGGSAVYNSQRVDSVLLGCGQSVLVKDIKRSVSLVERASYFFTFIVLLIALLTEGFTTWL